MVARDGGDPPQSSFTYVEVTILRETGQLSFDLPEYAVIISENLAVGRRIITASAQPGVSAGPWAPCGLEGDS